MFCGSEKQMHVTENTGHTELILILQIASVAPFQHQNRQLIHSGFGFPCDVKLTGAVGNLAVADKLSVYPYIKAGIHSFKIKVLFLFSLRSTDIKIFDVGAAGILVGYKRRIEGKRIPYIGILFLIKAKHLPAGRYLQPAEGLFVKILFVKFRHRLHIGIIAEFPVDPA